MVSKEKLYKVYQFLYFFVFIVVIILLILGHFQVINANYSGILIFFILSLSMLIRGVTNFRDRKVFSILSLLTSIICFFAFLSKVMAI